MVTHMDVDVQQLWRDYRSQPTVELRNQLVELYLPLVKYNAERIWSRLPEGVDLDDLISAGVFGLMDAIDAFDLERGVKFETYCVPRFAAPCSTSCAPWTGCRGWCAARPARWKRPASRSKRGSAGRRTADEMAAKLGVSLEELDKMVGDATAVSLVSLNKKWYETDSYKDVREIDILEDKKAEDPPTAAEPRPDAAGHTRPEPQRTAHHHPLLLRRHDDEGDRRDARPERIARQPDALQHRRSPAGPARPAPAGIQQLKTARACLPLAHARRTGVSPVWVRHRRDACATRH